MPGIAHLTGAETRGPIGTPACTKQSLTVRQIGKKSTTVGLAFQAEEIEANGLELSNRHELRHSPVRNRDMANSLALTHCQRKLSC